MRMSGEIQVKIAPFATILRVRFADTERGCFEVKNIFTKLPKNFSRTFQTAMSADRRNAHADWCNVWLNNDPCNCGAS